ncbi:hypothetical protein [Geopseudomonas aromaticivorans]
MLLPCSRLTAGFFLAASVALLSTPATANPPHSAAEAYGFRLALFSSTASREELAAAVALTDKNASGNGSGALIMVNPTQPLGSQVMKQLTAGGLTLRAEREGDVQGRRGVSVEIIIAKKDSADSLGIALAAHASEAVGERLRTAARYRESLITPQGTQIQHQEQIPADIAYGEALVILTKGGTLAAISPKAFTPGPEPVDPANQALLKELLESHSAQTPVIEQGAGAAIEWYGEPAVEAPVSAP